MKKIGLLVIACLLAVSGIMAAMAFTEAQVNNPATIGVTTTDQALIALSPGDYNNSVNIVDGVLELELGAGINGEMYGFQPNSKYIFDDLFTITNNTEGEVNIIIELTGALDEMWEQGVLEVYKRSFGVGEAYAQWVKLTPNPSFRHFFLGDHPQGWNPANIAFRFDFTKIESSEVLDYWEGINDCEVIVHAVPNGTPN
jgi:hypothetical protein